MIDKDKVKGILLDYGGTIDSNGVHWADVIWQRYQMVQMPITHDAFREAYIHGERTLALQPLITPDHNFLDLLKIKIQLQLDYLISNNLLISKCVATECRDQIANLCYDFAANTIKEAYPTLEYLATNYPIVLVTNFYGNISAVLYDFGIQHFFPNIIESAVVGIRKPNPEIWKLGVNALNLKPEETVVIGDSYKKDIEPAKQAGCQTIWLDVSRWDKLDDTSQADEIITNFVAIKNLFK